MPPLIARSAPSCPLRFGTSDTFLRFSLLVVGPRLLSEHSLLADRISRAFRTFCCLVLYRIAHFVDLSEQGCHATVVPMAAVVHVTKANDVVRARKLRVVCSR